jgi:hypothetical protein
LRLTANVFLVGVLFILASVFSSIFAIVDAQYVTVFSTTDRFKIPPLNGSIGFARNGSYSSAKLENNAWTFNDLKFNNVLNNSFLGNLKISVQDSNITIFSFYASNNISTTRQNMRYFAEGAGRQVVYLGVNGTTDPSEWWVTLSVPNSVFLAQGKDWQLLQDNTVIVTGQTGNISVTHSNFGTPEDSNLPFYQRHSILIGIIVIAAVTITVTTIISLRTRKKQQTSN